MAKENSIAISVVIPLYNGEDKITHCIKMLDRQTFCEKFEVIIVDDKSTDGSVDVVENFIESLEHKDYVRLIRNEQNGRAGKARNTGVKEAIGEYILFIDQDDYPDETMLQKLYDLTDGGVIDCTYCSVLDRNGNVYHRPTSEHITELTKEEKKNLIRDFGYVFAMLIRRSILITNDLRFPEQVMFEDSLYNYGVLSCVQSINGTEEVLYFRTDDERSQTASMSKKKLSDRISATVFYLQQYKKISATKDFEALIAGAALYYIYLSVVWWMIMNDKLYDRALFERAWKEAHNLGFSWREMTEEQNKFQWKSLIIMKTIYHKPWTMEFFRRLGSKYAASLGR